MDNDRLTLLLPVLWAVVATVIGLVLYKSSSALYSSSQKAHAETKRIRLAGSVAIAALAFYGIRLSTPSERLLGTKSGEITIQQSELKDLSDRSSKLDRTLLEVEGCVSTFVDDNCKREIRDAKSESANVAHSLSTLARIGQQ